MRDLFLLPLFLLLASGFPLHAATQPISFSFSGISSGTPNSNVGTGSGSGTLQPYGSATVTFSVSGNSTITAFIVISVTPNDTLQLSTQNGTGSGNTGSGNATVSGGTGMFAGATGSASFVLTLSIDASASGPFTLTGSGSIDVSTSGPAPPPTGLSFSIPQNGFSSQTIAIPNATAVAVTYNASVTTSTGGNWLSVQPASGAIAAGSTTAITVSVNATGLSPGTYQGVVTVQNSSGGSPTQISITLLVSAASQQLVLSQTGVRFQIAAGSSAPPPQTVFISNAGSGSLSFTAAAATLSGGNWLTATPASGSASASAPAALTISVNPSGLAPGDYYGRVDLASPTAANSPQSIEVVLSILAANVVTPPVIVPTGLIFVASPGSTSPTQTVQVSNPSSSSYALTTAIALQQGVGWLSVNPTQTTVAPAQTVTLSVSVNPASLAPGIYRGSVQILIAGQSSPYPVSVLLVVLPSASAQSTFHRAASPTCVPSQLLPVFTLLGDRFQTPAAFPAPLQVAVITDCGTPMTAGSVTAAFSSGDPPLALSPVSGGQWAATWQPRTVAGAQVTVSVIAQTITPALTGTTQVSGSVQPNFTAPIVNAIGVVSAASYAANTPLAPGSFISIFGANLAPGLVVASMLPLPTQLNNTQAFLGGVPLDLQFTSTGQINAIVPYGLAVNVGQQLIVQQGQALSLPQTIAISTAQPAVFTQDKSGGGPGVIVVVKADGTQFVDTAAMPATAGDALVIYCAGLGDVNPPVMAGSAAPSSPLSQTVNPVSVTIGNVPAQVFFAGLAPGFAGLYQVNVIVPPGIASGSNVPVVLSVAGTSSPVVTVALQ